MTLEERAPEADRLSLGNLPEAHGEVSLLGMSNHLHVLQPRHGDEAEVVQDHFEGPSNECNAANTASSPKHVTEAQAYLEASKSFTMTADKELEAIAILSHVSQRDSMQTLKERLKEKLKEKLKPKLRQTMKNRQEPALQLTLLPSQEDAATSQANESVGATHHLHGEPLASDVRPLKVLPADRKIEPEHAALNYTTPCFSLGKEAGGQLVKSNGRKRAGAKTPNVSRVSRFADSILHFVGERSVPEKLIRGALGNNPDISKAIRLLLTEKKLKRLGDGGKGCAYVYVRTGQLENKVKPGDLDEGDARGQAIAIERDFVLELGRRFPVTNAVDPFVWNRYGRMQGDQLQCDI